MSWLSKMGDKVYGQTQRGWLGGKANDIVGDDYQKHLINATLGGGPIAAFGTDYQQGKADDGDGWGRVGENAGKSAAILAAIFGGSALAGGGGGGGAGAGGTGVGTGSGIGAENGGLMIDQGAGAGAGTDWMGMAQQFMGSGGLEQMMGGGGQQQGVGAPPSNEQDRLIEAMVQQQMQQRMKEMRGQQPEYFGPAGQRGIG